MDREILAASIERREDPRRTVLGNITIYHPGTLRSYEGKILNISTYGLRCDTDISLNIMTPVKIHVHQSTDIHSNMTFTGKVVWGMRINDLNSGMYRYGIKLEPNT